MMPLDPSKRLRIRESKTLDQILGLFFVLFEVWASGQISVRHTKLLSRFAWSPHASGWKEDSSNCRTEGGHGPFRGLDAPFALEMKVKNFRAEVNRARRTGQERSGIEVSWRQKKEWRLDPGRPGHNTLRGVPDIGAAAKNASLTAGTVRDRA
jgi:hypothetical protein